MPTPTKKPRPLPLAPKFYVSAQGVYLGAFSGIQRNPNDPATIEQPMPSDPNAVEVPTPPPTGRYLWKGAKWVPQPKAPRDLEAEFLQLPDWFQATIELVPGGKAAVKARLQP